MVEEAELARAVEERLNSARERIAAAENLLKEGMLPDAVNRTYYAIFNAAKAVLITIGKDPKTHSGLLSEFGMWVIQKGLMPKEYGVILRKAFESRQTADYEMATEFSSDEVEDMLKGARKFVSEAERVSNKELKKYEEV